MQYQKSCMGKRKFRIGDLAKKLKVKKYVIRFWEKEFVLNSDRSEGGQRFYSAEDLAVFTAIKELLYDRCFTISGAKKELSSLCEASKLSSNVSVQDKNIIGVTQERSMHEIHGKKEAFFEEIKNFKQQLLIFKKKIE